jgi:hypothetical protein
MKSHKLAGVAVFATLVFPTIAIFGSAITLIGCATPKPAVRPAISQTAVTVQRHDSKTNEGGKVSIYIDDKEAINNLEDMQTGTALVNNGVHVINAKCPNGESAMLNFTANSKTVAFLTAYKSGGFFSKSDCRLERMNVDDDTGYMTNEKQQQSYNDQSKIKKQPDYDPYAEIEKLADLKQKGIITEEEFQFKKKEILGR